MRHTPSEFTILIVDDVESNTLLLKMLIADEGYNTLVTDNGVKALELVEKFRPDLILLDIMMPEMDGYEVARRLKDDSKNSHIPIIFLSALNRTDDIVKGFQVGGADYVTKPFNKDELIARVHHQISLVHAMQIIDKQTKELKKILADREKLYSIIAHDLRSPLSSVKMVLELLVSNSSHQSLGEELFDLLTMADRIVDDSFILLDNLLKWTKSQSGRLTVTLQENVDIRKLIEEVIESFKEIAGLKQIDLKIVGSPKRGAKVDVDMIKTTIRNLICNAIKFSYQGSTVMILLKEKKDRLFISIKDKGAGISKERQSLLLNSETHFSTYGTSNEGGSGLGLLICKEFVKKSGGELTFTSKEGEGSTFTFDIPLM